MCFARAVPDKIEAGIEEHLFAIIPVMLSH